MSGAAASPDAAARAVATTVFDRNLAVIAGAGTGKTSLLVERVLVMVGLDVAGVEEIAAITFTLKAAGEMRQRIAAGLERLIELAEAPPADLDERQEADRAYRYLTVEAKVAAAALHARALAALTSLDRAVIETIHGFCARVLREHPLEAGVDPDFAVDQGEHFEAAVEDAWERFLESELGAESPRLELWRRVLSGFPLSTVETAARTLASFSIPEDLLRRAEPPIDACRVYADEIEHIAERSAWMLRNERGLTDKSRHNLEVIAQLYALIRQGGLAALRRAVADSPGLSDRLARRTRYPRPSRGLSGIDGAELEQLGKRALRLAWNLSNIDESLMIDLVEAVAPFVSSAREESLSRGYVGFDGLLVLTRDLLRDHPEVREGVRRRFRMLLLDEFQDTDPLQYEIVFFLAERPGGRARRALEADLEPGRLFIVGDPKQSIYRFRGADYTAFRLAVQRVVDRGGRLLHLTANFRSVPELLAPVNAMFAPGDGGVWEESPFQPEYVAVRPAREPAGGPRVELWTVECDEGGAAQRRLREGEAVADEITRLIDERGLEPGSITVLLRAFSDLAFYLRPLRERGIPFVVDGGREFLRRPEVGHLIATLRALARPTDQVALLAFLRSPAGGVPDTELARHVADGGRLDDRHPEVDARSCPALARAMSLLQTLDQETRHGPADRVVHRVLARTRLELVSAVAFEGAQRVANLGKLASAAARIAREGKLSLIEVIDALEAERSADVESDSPLADEGVQAVRVMTIHKAKGLENEVVIVPDLARHDPGVAFAPFEAEVVTLPDGTRTLALQARRVRNAAGLWFSEERGRHEQAEGYRVLYVAMTRARQRLILLAGEPHGHAPWIEALGRWGYDPDEPPENGPLTPDGLVLHALRGPAPTARRRLEPPGEGAPGAVEAWNRAWGHLRATLAPPFRRPSRDDEEPLEEPDPRRRGRGREIARRVGSAVHRALESWDRRGRDSLLALGRRFAREDEAAADEVAGLLSDFVGSELGRRLRDCELVGRELSILLRPEGDESTWVGSIDLLYRDEEGRLVVADFKTDDERDSRRLGERYRDQLRIYAEAVRRACALEYLPRTELWLLRAGRVMEL